MRCLEEMAVWRRILGGPGGDRTLVECLIALTEVKTAVPCCRFLSILVGSLFQIYTFENEEISMLTFTLLEEASHDCGSKIRSPPLSGGSLQLSNPRIQRRRQEIIGFPG